MSDFVNKVNSNEVAYLSNQLYTIYKSSASTNTEVKKKNFKYNLNTNQYTNHSRYLGLSGGGIIDSCVYEDYYDWLPFIKKNTPLIRYLLT